MHGFIFVLFHLMPRGRTKHLNFCTSLLSLTWGPRVKRAPERLHWVLVVGSPNAIPRILSTATAESNPGRLRSKHVRYTLLPCLSAYLNRSSDSFLDDPSPKEEFA